MVSSIISALIDIGLEAAEVHYEVNQCREILQSCPSS